MKNFAARFFSTIAQPYLNWLLQWIFDVDWSTAVVDGEVVLQDKTGDETREIQEGRSYFFNWTRVDWGDVVDYQFLKDDTFSFSAWINPASTTSNRSILSKQGVAFSWRHFYISAGVLTMIAGKLWDFAWVKSTTSLPLNTWTHVSWTYSWNSLSSWFKLYFNWVSQTTSAFWAAIVTPYAVNWTFQIGNRFDNATPFSWKIMWAALWDIELDATQALEVYNARDYSTLSTFANVKWLYKCDEQDWVDSFDSSGNSNHWTIIGATLPVFHATDPLIPVSFQNNYWWTDWTWANWAVVGAFIPRDESNTTLDVAGNTLDFTGRVRYHADLVESSCGDFDGIDDYADTNYQLPFGTSDFSVSAWVDTTANTKTVFSTMDLAGGGLSDVWVSVRIDALWQVLFVVWDWTTTVATSTGVVNDWLPHHIACVRDGVSWASSMKIYIDWVLDWTGDASSKDITVTENAIIWAHYIWDYTWNSWYFQWKIRDCRTFSAVLTIPNIVNIMTGAVLWTETTLYSFSEWAWSIVYDLTANGNNANLFWITVATFWGFQDKIHWNLLRGFSLYDHASLGDIWVGFDVTGIPLVITPETWYTKTSDNPSWNRHNAANTKFRQRTKIPALIYVDEQLPVWDYWFDSASAYDPIAKDYLSIVENVETFDIIMADESVVNQRKNILTYDQPLSWPDLLETTTYLNH